MERISKGMVAAVGLVLAGCSTTPVVAADGGGSTNSSGGVGGTSGGDCINMGSCYGGVACPVGSVCFENTFSCCAYSDAGPVGGTTGGSSSGGSSGGSSSGGAIGPCGAAPSGPYITVTLQQTGIHPAEVAALAARGMTPPSTVGQQVSIQGISLCNLVPSYTTLGTITITAQNQNGPLVFPNLAVGGVNVGVIASYEGYGMFNGVPIQPPSCAQIAPDGGYANFPAATASEVFVGTPTADITVPAAFNISWDYATLLDCAQGLTPGTLLSGGFALLYATEAGYAVDGGIAGVTFQQNSGGGHAGLFCTGLRDSGERPDVDQRSGDALGRYVPVAHREREHHRRQLRLARARGAAQDRVPGLLRPKVGRRRNSAARLRAHGSLAPPLGPWDTGACRSPPTAQRIRRSREPATSLAHS